MIASVDYVLIGAGLPAQIPEALDLLAQHRPTRYLITVEGSQSHDQFAATFDPKRFSIAAPFPTVLLPDHQHFPGGNDSRPAQGWSDRRLDHRGPDGRRAQCTATVEEARSRRRAGVRAERRGRSRPDQRAGPALLPGRLVRRPGAADEGS